MRLRIERLKKSPLLKTLLCGAFMFAPLGLANSQAEAREIDQPANKLIQRPIDSAAAAFSTAEGFCDDISGDLNIEIVQELEEGFRMTEVASNRLPVAGAPSPVSPELSDEFYAWGESILLRLMNSELDSASETMALQAQLTALAEEKDSDRLGRAISLGHRRIAAGHILQGNSRLALSHLSQANAIMPFDAEAWEAVNSFSPCQHWSGLE